MIMAAVCLSSNVNTEQLRSQLDQLHLEAETTRRKANNARFRLLRLSEAAETLCRQAAKNIQMGKEHDARDLLLQKKRIMLALDKSKGRVEVLDELASKLNEAISIKEAQLVRNVASDFEIGGDDEGNPVRIVPPTQNSGESLEESLDYDNNVTLNNIDVGEEQKLVSDLYNEANMVSYSEADNLTVPENINSGSKASLLSSLRGASTYNDFLEHVDQQLNKIEQYLITILELSTLVLGNEEKLNNSRVQQIWEILEKIRGTRERIRNFMQNIVETT